MITKFDIFENTKFHNMKQIDDIIDKISLNGYESLDDSEKAILNNFTKDDEDINTILVEISELELKAKILHNKMKKEIFDDLKQKYLEQWIKITSKLTSLNHQLEHVYKVDKHDIWAYQDKNGLLLGDDNDYNDYDEENESKINENVELSGKNSFLTFLQIISNHNYHFISNDFYTKIYQYQFYFSTETIKNVNEFIEIFKYKQSLAACYDILPKIEHAKLAFFFGIKENSQLRYGFLDLDTQRSYIVGEFQISGGYFKSISKYKCIQYINKIIQNIDVKNIPVLAKIKQDFTTFYNTKKSKKIEIIENKVINYFDKQDFTEEDIKMNRPYRILDSWISKKSWRNKIEYNVDDTTDQIKFIIIIK